MKSMKKIIPVWCILILAMIFTACVKEDATEESHWTLDSVTSIKNTDGKINVDEVFLTLKDGEIIIEDAKNGETYNGAYEDLYATDNENDYKVIIDGKTGSMEKFEVTDSDVIGKAQLRLTVDDYDLLFVENK